MWRFTFKEYGNTIIGRIAMDFLKVFRFDYIVKSPFLFFFNGLFGPLAIFGFFFWYRLNIFEPTSLFILIGFDLFNIRSQ